MRITILLLLISTSLQACSSGTQTVKVTLVGGGTKEANVSYNVSTCKATVSMPGASNTGAVTQGTGASHVKNENGSSVEIDYNSGTNEIAVGGTFPGDEETGEPPRAFLGMSSFTGGK